MGRSLSPSAALVLCLFGLGCSDEPVAAATRDAGGAPVDAGLDAGVELDAGVDAGVPSVDACNPVLQSGCSAPTTKCVVENPMSGLGTSCVEPGAELALGSACGGRDCAAGLACVATSSTTSRCVQVCSFVDGVGCETLGSEYDCRRRITGTVWGACTELNPVCTLPAQDPCEPSQACQPYLRRNGVWELRCRPQGDTGEGQACGSSAGGAVCRRGLVCVADGASGAVCRRACDDDGDCAAPSRCVGTVNTPAFSFCTN